MARPSVTYPDYELCAMHEHHMVGHVRDAVSRKRDRRSEDGGEVWLLAGDEDPRSGKRAQRLRLEFVLVAPDGTRDHDAWYDDPANRFGADAIIEFSEWFIREFFFHATFEAPPGAPIQGRWLAQIHRDGGEGREPFTVGNLMPFDETRPDTLDPVARQEIASSAVRQAGWRRDEGKFTEAKTLLDRALNLHDKDAHGYRDALYLRAQCRMELRHFDVALADLDALLALSPDHIGALTARGRVLLARGDKAKARADLDRAAAAGWPEAIRLIADAYPPPPPSNRVRHKVYGEGTIVKRLEGDKLEIDFGAAGKKTLAARFVEVVG